MALYLYVRGNPLLLIDPLGLWGFSDVGYFFQGAWQNLKEHATANWEAMKEIAKDPCELPGAIATVHDQITTDMANKAVATSLNTGGDLSTGELLTDIAGQMTGMKPAAEAIAGVDLAQNRLLSMEERIFEKTAEAAGGISMVAGTAAALAAPFAGATRAVVTTENAAATLPEGSFSIRTWTGYPDDLSRPSGPFRILEGAEYDAARSAANSANQAMHASDPSLAGLQIHEIQPVKFGGSPVDIANKIPLSPAQHMPATTWWNQLQRTLQR